MESTVPVVRFVKCPKCFKILTEFTEVPLYKCGGCDVVLRAKAHLFSGHNSSTLSDKPASQNLTDIDPLINAPVILGKEVDHIVSDSGHENISMEKSLEHEQSEISNIPDSKGCKEVEKSIKVNPEPDNSFKSSDKLNEALEIEQCTTSEEDVFKIVEFANETHFRTNMRSTFHAYDGSASSTDEDVNDHIPRRYLLSRRTHRNKYMPDSVFSKAAAENSNPYVQGIEQGYTFASQPPFRSSSCSTKDPQLKINHRSSEQEDQVKILNKVDELRHELRSLFNETANDKALIGKVPSKEFRYTLSPFSGHHNSQVYTHLSKAAALPFHMQSNAINQEQQDLKHKPLRSQPIIRLCSPVSGGAPFVVCYKCFKLLQLPADFLVLPKRLHKLRCGACLQLLLFSFRARSLSFPQTPEEFQHPSEENESPFENITGWDPTSTSEDSYISIAKSNSSEVGPAINISSSNEIVEDEGVGRDVVGSRLHNLLGYSSARELFFNEDYSYDGHQRTDSEMPNFYRPSGRRRWEER